MWCADCETIEHYFYDSTTFYFFVPTEESFGKLASLCGSLGFDAKQIHSHCIQVTLAKSEIDTLLLGFFGELNGQERKNTKVTTTPAGTEFGLEAAGRMIDAESFVNRYKSTWIVESVEQGNYESWFQPIIHTQDWPSGARSPYGHEALFRMRDNNGTIIPPGHVFGIAAKSDLLFALDLTARRSAIEHAAKAKLRSKVFVNFDPSSIYDPSYCLRTTAAAIDEAGINVSDVVFEVTETNKAKDLAHLKGILAFYRSAGFKVALDDIGAGWSGLTMLNELSPDYVKIDMALVRDIHLKPKQQTIVRHLVEIAKENGIKIIAEGIEVKEEAQCLSEFQVDFMQGYLFGKPALLQP
ncbi:MAG: EAL domain-containing protein [Aestuariibacter sp.]